jgi:hypothetical protein
MNELFADYMPEAWYEEAGLRKSAPLRTSSTVAKRMRRLKNRAKTASISFAASAALAIASLAVGDVSAATNALDVPPPQGIVVAPPPGAEDALGSVNESFAQLFSAFRSGTKLITNERTRQLAKAAAERRNARPDGWARRLASDVGDADD